MVTIAEIEDLEQVYRYQMGFRAPYFFPVDYQSWKESFLEDVDGEGRTLFRELTVKAAYDADSLIGFVQYGKTAFGFDNQGEASSDVSYCVIRNLYFDEGREDAGDLLLREAMDAFAISDTVYTFFHFFGMTCFARHGKLFEQHDHIARLFQKHGFETEHENVYYASFLSGEEVPEAEMIPHGLTKGNQQYIDFVLSGDQVGGCELHYVSRETAYLRWIYVNENLTGSGIGTQCMHALRHWLSQQGITRFDTDTALSNSVAQHYYEKNGFTRAGITRSYYRKS